MSKRVWPYYKCVLNSPRQASTWLNRNDTKLVANGGQGSHPARGFIVFEGKRARAQFAI